MLSLKLQATIHKKNSVYIIVVLIPLEQHWTGQNPMRYCLRVYRQHTTGKNPVQCCLNTPGTILHRKNPQYCLRGSRQHFTGKIPYNVFWTPSGHFPAIFILDWLIFYYYLVAANATSTLFKFSWHCTRKIPGQNRTKRQACTEQWYCTCMFEFY